MRRVFRNKFTLGAIALAGAWRLSASAALAVTVDLGTAGPDNWAVLEIAGDSNKGSISMQQQNVSAAAAPPHGSVEGNIGAANVSHVTTSAGNFPISGTVYIGDQSTADSATADNASGGVVTDEPRVGQAATDARNASAAAAALAASGGGVGVDSITSGGTLTPGVYDLTDLNLPNNAELDLTAGGSYVFNISGTLALHSARIIAASGLSASDILFNVTGTSGVAFSGGLNNECVLDGIILAPTATVSLTPGLVNGEIISGRNINIASGGSVVPEASSSILFVVFGVALLGGSRVRFVAQRRVKFDSSSYRA